MKALKPKVVLEMNDWLPSYGENSVKMETQGDDLILKIACDSLEDVPIERVRRITFQNVVFFYKTSVPGASAKLLNIDYDEERILAGTFRSLYEFTLSELADKWTKYFKLPVPFRHYRIWFLAENLGYVVIAQNFSWIDGEQPMES